MQTEQATEDIDRVNNPNIIDVNVSVNVNKVDNPYIDKEGATSCDSNYKSKIRCPKIVCFSINYIISHGYFM